MIKRSTINIPRKGKIRLLIAAMLSLDMEQETIRHMPMGGVSMPMARLVTTITPSCIMSIPREGSMAVIIGTSSMSAAVVSTNVPAISRTIFISRSRITGLSDNPNRVPASWAGMSSIAAIQLKTEAVAIINMTIADVTAPLRNRWKRSFAWFFGKLKSERLIKNKGG